MVKFTSFTTLSTLVTIPTFAAVLPDIETSILSFVLLSWFATLFNFWITFLKRSRDVAGDSPHPTFSAVLWRDLVFVREQEFVFPDLARHLLSGAEDTSE